MTALDRRHANELVAPPPASMPSQIIHLPIGGWTTYAALSR